METEFIIHPGETVKEVLSDRKISLELFSYEMGMDLTECKRLLDGSEDISPETAERLEMVLNIDRSFWENLQKIYDKEKRNEKLKGGSDD